jgi:hypothetical protein
VEASRLLITIPPEEDRGDDGQAIVGTLLYEEVGVLSGVRKAE